MMKKISVSLIIILIIVTCIFSNVFATDMTSIYTVSMEPGIRDATAQALGIVQVVGYAVAIIMLTYIGIKFIFDTPDQKAKHKEQLIPYIIGVVILFAGSTIAVWFGSEIRKDSTSMISYNQTVVTQEIVKL